MELPQQFEFHTNLGEGPYKAVKEKKGYRINFGNASCWYGDVIVKDCIEEQQWVITELKEDERNKVTERALKTLEAVMKAQDDYGMKKYNTALDHTQEYNWIAMFYEEMADALKYIQCEMDRKAQIIDLLELALTVKEPKVLIEIVLKLMKTSGTGK